MMRRTILLVATMALTLLVASGVALAVNKIGGPGPDTLRGTKGADNLLGMGGNDQLIGRGGRDNLLGGSGKDAMFGGPGGDNNLVGGQGNDGIIAGQGSDKALGGEGNDLLIDGDLRESSNDTFLGGPGNDVLIVSHVPAFKDIVVCGSGFDRVAADPKDTVAPDCEKVGIIRTAAQDERFFRSIPQSFFEGLPPVFF
jgi:Ca2+-binding RTX toxin-like protein